MKSRQGLQSHYEAVSKLHLRQLFKEDPGRGERMTAEAEGIFLDYSKNRITQETLDLLVQLAAERRLQVALPDGALGVRKYFESPYRAGEKLTVEDFYRWIFENSVPGLPAAAAKEGLTPLAYMRGRRAHPRPTPKAFWPTPAGVLPPGPPPRRVGDRRC